MTVSPPPVGPNLQQWARATRSYLQRWLPRLQWKRQDDNPSDDGVILWDGEIEQPVVSKQDRFRRIPLTDIVFVSFPEDLPDAVAGVISLGTDTTYLFNAAIDLQGDRLVSGQGTVIIGTSSETASISSTGLTGAALITSVCNFAASDITLDAEEIFDLDGTTNPGSNVFLDGVSIENATTIGTITEYDNVICRSGGFRNSSGLTFDGEFGTISFNEYFFDSASTGTVITIPSTVTITRRFRVIYSAFVTDASATALNVSTSATIPVESYILDTCNFTGAGTFISGVQHNDNKSLFVNNVGVSNSANVSNYTMTGNTTVTTITTAATPVKIAGSTTSNTITQRFTNTDNRATYTGAITRNFRVDVFSNIEGPSNNVLKTYVAKNGTVISSSVGVGTTGAGGRGEGFVSATILSLATNDYVEAWVENTDTTTDVTVTDLNVVVDFV